MDSPGFMVLMMLLGAVLVFILIYSQVNQAQQDKQKRKSEELDEKIKYQNFILAVKKKFPKAKFEKLGYGLIDIHTLNADLLNPNQKKIGNIRLQASRDSSYPNYSVTFSITVTIKVMDKIFEKEKKGIKDDMDSILFNMESLLTEIFSNVNFQNLVIATTY